MSEKGVKKGLSEILKNPTGMLAGALVLILLGSFLAGMFHSSFFSVKITEIKFKTDRGTLVGLLYMPKGTGENDPRPVIVTTHGYLNTKEMQDAPAIEMSRRGYIVLALDMYDHGDSRWAADIAPGSQFATFWIWSQFDAATYMYQQPYTLKDADGNGYIAVSGHSMGGFSSFVAMYMDEMASQQTGVRMIYAGIPVGSDFTYTGSIAPNDKMRAALGSRTVGNIGAHYDEFFFGKSKDEMTDEEIAVPGTVKYKDFAATVNGKLFVGLDPNGSDAIAGNYYTVESGELIHEDNVIRESQTGTRVIYTPNETHPWNHFSKETTSALIEFYTFAFDGVRPVTQTSAGISPGSQIWFWKEFFSLISLIGFFLLVLPIAGLLLKLPLLKKAITPKVATVTAEKTTLEKSLFWIVTVGSILYPALWFKQLMDRQTDALGNFATCALIIAGLGIAIGIFCLLKSKNRKDVFHDYGIGGFSVTGISLTLYGLFKFAPVLAPLNKAFNEPTVNQIVYWAIINGIVAGLILTVFYFFGKKQSGTKPESYGIHSGAESVIGGLLTGLLTVVAVYLVLFCTKAIFGVDYRFWTLAVRTFTTDHVATALRYMPLFFIYFFINAVALNANTRGRKYGYTLAILLNIGGLVLWVALQYGLLFATGVAMQSTQALNGILLFALIPCLAIAAVYARKLFEKTNNIWLGAFVNTILFTMITCANTTMFYNLTY